MKVVTYHITLLEPTLVTSLNGDPNSAVAFPYLPGSALRGAVIGKYLRQEGLSQFDSTDATMRRLFFDATTRYLNGYPVGQQRRTLPTPLSWQQRKGYQTDLYDFAVEPCDDAGVQWQGVSHPFCTLHDKHVSLIHPHRHITVHTARTRRYGRAMPRHRLPADEIPGAVYRYDALAAGQTFAAAIFCDHDADAPTLMGLLQEEAILGGSRSGGYGRVRFSDATERFVWRETGDSSLPPEADDYLVVTCVSDVLLRNANGQHVVDSDVVTTAVSARLGGVPLTLHPDRTFLRGCEVGGFNRTWGLPLPQMLAVQMGSVFVYDIPACSPGLFQTLEAYGIGERRAEGFGRLAVNWQSAAQLIADDAAPPQSPGPVAIPVDTPSACLAQRMVTRMLRQRLDACVIATATHSDMTMHNPPSHAQLSRLRNTIQNALMQEQPALQPVETFLDSIRQRRTARQQFERARIGEMRLLTWLDARLQNTGEAEWRALLGLQPRDIHKIGDVTAPVTDTLRIEYLLRFLHAVLAQAAKQQ